MSGCTIEKLEQAYRDLDYLQPLSPDGQHLAHELTDPFLVQLARANWYSSREMAARCSSFIYIHKTFENVISSQ